MIGKRDTERVGDRLAHGASLLWLATMSQRLLQVVVVLLLARLLTPQDYGIVSAAVVIATFLDVVTNIQMGSAVARIEHLEHAHLDTAFTLNLLRGILSSVIIGLLAHPAAVFMHLPQLQTVMYVLMIPPILNGLSNPYFSLFARNLDFKRQSMRDALAYLVGAIAGIAVAFAYHSYWALVVNGISAAAVRVLLSYWRAQGRPGLSLSKSRDLLVFGGWITAVAIADYVASRMDFLLIGNRIGAKALGAYNVANALTTTFTLDIVGVLTQALLPGFSTIAGDTERLRRGYREVQTITMALALPIGFGISAVAPHLVPLLVGAKWMQAIPAVEILAPVTALQTMTASVEAMAYTLNKGMLICIRAWLFLVVRAGFMVAGFMLGGFIGVVWARATCAILQLIYNLFLVQQLIGAPASGPLVSGWRSLVSAAAMFGVVAVLPLPDLFSHGILQLLFCVAVQAVVGGTVYIGLHTSLWAVCGFPPGAEKRLINQARRLTSRTSLQPHMPGN